MNEGKTMTIVQSSIFEDMHMDINSKEAPEGFYAVHKEKAETPNVCVSCEARTLCQENKNDWCLKNRCMSYEVAGIDGQSYKRKDGQPVFFKRLRAEVQP